MLLPNVTFSKGNWALGYFSIRIWNFFLFPNFLRSLILSRLTTREQHLYQVCFIRYHSSFTSEESNLYQNVFQSLVARVVRKCFFSSLRFQWRIIFSEKKLIWVLLGVYMELTKGFSMKNLQSWKPCKVKFSPKNSCETVLTQNH